AAVIYILATVCLVIGNRVSHRIAISACVIEFIGVIVVGILSHTHPEDFAKPSVWSNFGIGYGFIPLVLPLIGLWWLIRRSEERRVGKEGGARRGQSSGKGK